MTDLEQQIHAYYDRIIIPVTTDEYTQPIGRSISLRRNRAWVMATAFVVVLVGVGITILVLGGTKSSFVEKSPAPTLTSLEWTRIPLDSAFLGDSGANVSAVTVGGPGFVAVGATLCEGRTTDCSEDAAVWTSTDGFTWTRVPHDPEVFGGDGAQVIEDITVGGPGLVAVGLRFDEPRKSGLAAAVWTSADGFTWTPVFDDDLAVGSGNWMRSVTSGGPGLVAVGSDSWAGKVWTSPDGINWTAVPQDPEIFGYGESWESHTEIHGITPGGPGLIAWGFDDGYSSSGIWTSSDGTTWSRTEIEGGRYINAVIEGGPGFVAVGGYEDEPTGCHGSGAGECYATVWTSSDGSQWTALPHDEAIFGGGNDKQMMHTVTTIGSNLIAVGTRVWVSNDGITWTIQYDNLGTSGAEQNGMYDIAVGPNSIVATGHPYDEPAIWTTTPGN